MAADARGDLVDAASVDADAGRRPDADDLVVRESTTQTTTTTTRTVTMDADGNVVDERETVESNVAGDVPSARAATTATDVAGFDALTLTEGQIDVVADLLRENHGVDVGPDELRDLLARTRTRKKYRGVETREWDEREREAGRDDAETENDEGIVALVGNLLRGLLGGDDEKPRAPPARSACSANVVFDKPPTDPEARSRAVAAATAAIPASAAAASGLLARRDAKPQASRGAWRAAKTAADLGESAVSPADAASSRDALCSASMPAAERRRILDGEAAASRAQAAKLRSFGAAQKWRAAGALGRFVAGSVDARARRRRVPGRRGGGGGEAARAREAANREVLVTVRRKVVDSKGNVLETSETKGASLGHETRPRCTCFERATVVRSAGFGGARRGFRETRVKSEPQPRKKACPVHFPLASGAAASKGAPSRAPAKTHAAAGGGERGGGAPAARDDDAGYVLYETEGNFYLASHDHTRLKWRIARIARRADALDVDEHAATYDRESLKAVMFALHKGNEASGGLRVVAQGAGVVSLLELAAPGGDDPASAAATGPDAVIARAEQLHRERAARLARRNGVETSREALAPTRKRAPREERAEARLAGGALRARENLGACLFRDRHAERPTPGARARSRRGRRAGQPRGGDARRDRRARARGAGADEEETLEARGAGGKRAGGGRRTRARARPGRERHGGSRASAQADHRPRVFERARAQARAW